MKVITLTREQIESWMRQAIDLAEQGRGHVEPNPMVGCVIVKNDSVIGQGYHKKFGGPHAEINALESCSESPNGATVIVTLEPCCHHGKTPPCSKALIDAGVAEVIIGLRDPNPVVDGQGINELVQVGIKTSSGYLESEVAIQNSGFLKKAIHNRPWIIAKYAMTMDGNIATSSGNSKWISNEECRKHVHQLRGQVDAIITGSNTVLTDNPKLNARPHGPRLATKVIFDSALVTPLDSQIVKTAKQEPVILIAKSTRMNNVKADQLSNAGVEIIVLDEGYVDRIDVSLDILANRGMTNVMLEGGGKLLGEFCQAKQIDELRTYIAPILIGQGIQPNTGFGLKSIAEGEQLTLLETKEIAGNVYTRSVRKAWLESINLAGITTF